MERHGQHAREASCVNEWEAKIIHKQSTTVTPFPVRWRVCSAPASPCDAAAAAMSQPGGCVGMASPFCTWLPQQLAWNCRWPVTACQYPLDCLPDALPGGVVGLEVWHQGARHLVQARKPAAGAVSPPLGACMHGQTWLTWNCFTASTSSCRAAWACCTSPCAA